MAARGRSAPDGMVRLPVVLVASPRWVARRRRSAVTGSSASSCCRTALPCWLLVMLKDGGPATRPTPRCGICWRDEGRQRGRRGWRQRETAPLGKKKQSSGPECCVRLFVTAPGGAWGHHGGGKRMTVVPRVGKALAQSATAQPGEGVGREPQFLCCRDRAVLLQQRVLLQKKEELSKKPQRPSNGSAVLIEERQHGVPTGSNGGRRGGTERCRRQERHGEPPRPRSASPPAPLCWTRPGLACRKERQSAAVEHVGPSLLPRCRSTCTVPSPHNRTDRIKTIPDRPPNAAPLYTAASASAGRRHGNTGTQYSSRPFPHPPHQSPAVLLALLVTANRRPPPPPPRGAVNNSSVGFKGAAPHSAPSHSRSRRARHKDREFY